MAAWDDGDGRRDGGAEASFAAFLAAYNDINAMYDAFARRSGVSVTEFWALLYVSEGVTEQHELARTLSLSRQTVNSAISKLVERGYVELIPDTTDRRVKHVHLTPAGEAFADEHIGALHGLEERLWSGFDEYDRNELGALLAEFRDAMRVALSSVWDDDPPPLHRSARSRRR